MTDGRRNIRTTTPTKVPGLTIPPANIDRTLCDYLVACGEALEIRLGRKGDVRDRAITLRELIDSGLAKELRNKPFDPNNTQVDFGDSTPFSDTPTAPVSFTVTAGYSVITLKWEGPFYSYQGHSFTEVWRHTANTLADATFIGSSSNIYYIDAVGSGSATYYYWIRHVSTSNETGPWSNNGVGVSAATQTDVATLLSTLSTAITSSQLHSDLSTPIGNLPADTNASITAINTTTTSLGAKYTVKIATATSGGGQHVAGFGLATQANNGTVTSAFIVAADKFAIVNGTNHSQALNASPSSGNVPFAVTAEYTDSDTGITVPAGTYIKSAFIDKATIHNLVAGSVVGDYIKAAVVMDAPHMHVGTINIGTINKTDADNPRTWSHSGTNRISNFSVDANGVMHATGAEMNGILIKATDGTVLLNSNGIVAGSGGNLAFNGNLDQGLTTIAANGTTSASTSALEGWVATGNSAGTPTFNATLGWVRVYQEVTSGDPPVTTKYTATVRQNSPRFQVSAGEDLYVYCHTGSTTGMWMAVAYFDNPDGADANTGYSCITAVALSASTMSTETITGESGASRQFAVGKVTVPTSGYSNSKRPLYGELRFGNNSSGPVSDLYFFSVGVSRTPPVLDPLYASTYIRNLSVDTLQIQDEAVTVPDGETGTGLSINLGSTYADVSPTNIILWDSDKSPSALIVSGAIQMVGADTSGSASGAAGVNIRFYVEWKESDGSYTYDSTVTNQTAATQSMRSSYGGQVVTTVRIVVPSGKIGVRVHVEGRNVYDGGGNSTSRKCEGYGYFILGAKK